MKYSFHPWHSYFLTRAREEISNLKKIFPDAKIEHFGSTAVKGLGGKGIIDISISVKKNDFDSTQKKINENGYIFSPTGGIQGQRHFFRKLIRYQDGHKQLFHLHLTRMDNADMKDCLDFRDFLQNNPVLAEEYSNIKLKAVINAKKFHKKADKKKAYMNIKGPLIEKILMDMKNKS